MLTLGLTGGIGAGKTSLARVLEGLGAKVLYLDDVARSILAPGTEATAEVVQLWPSTVKDGAVDRKALGQIVFSDPQALDRLNAIVHPRTWQAERRQLAAWQSQGVDVALVELALLASSERQWGFHANLVVDAPLQARIDRLSANRAMSPQDAASRIASQRPREEVLAIADFVVDNSGGQRDLAAAAQSAWQEWIAPFAANLAAGRRLAGRDEAPTAEQRHRAWQRLHYQGAVERIPADVAQPDAGQLDHIRPDAGQHDQPQHAAPSKPPADAGGEHEHTPRDRAAFARAGFVPDRGSGFLSADPLFRMKV